MRAAYTFEMLSTAARYVAQLMLPGGLGLRSTALTSSSISGIHDAADGAIGGTVPRRATRRAARAVLAIAGSARASSAFRSFVPAAYLDGRRKNHGVYSTISHYSYNKL